ncbi:MAG: ATP-binding protein [Rhodospirillales bacterium]
MSGSMRKSKLGWALVGLALAAAVLAVWLTTHWARSLALDTLRQRSAETLRLTIDNLGVELDRYIFLPRVLSTNPAVLAAVGRRALGAELSRADRELEEVEAVTGAADIFLYDVGGTVIAGRTDDGGPPGIGADLSALPFFHAALEGRLGRFFTAYPDTLDPVYAYAHPVWIDNEVRGVVVVVVNLGELQDRFKLVTAEHEIIVQDRQGIAFLSSRQDWRLRKVLPLSATDREEIAREGRYVGLALQALPIRARQDKLYIVHEDGGEGPAAGEPAYLRLERPLPRADWRVSILVDTAAVGRQVAQAGAISVFAAASLFLLLVALYQRRRRIEERMALQKEATARLEDRVRERTSELMLTNRRLLASIAEREKAEGDLRQAQEELIQASKLAALGQMSAGLSHELNQPLAAIRSYADNASAYLDRDEPGKARKNLTGIGELTERMARIIRNLRTYARNEQTPVRPVLLSEALSGATALLEARIRAVNAEVRIADNAPGVLVMGGDVRLQQVFVNLLANALDAVETQTTRDIDIGIAATDGEDLVITVRDSGPGIDPAQIGSVFDPFYSTKEVGKGMGLGLSITFGIVELFGGRITAANHPDGGALFTIILRRAEAGRSAAE